MQKKEYDSNKQYASEVLSILLQGGREVVVKVWEQDGVEVLLKVLSVSDIPSRLFEQYRRQGGTISAANVLVAELGSRADAAAIPQEGSRR